MSLLEVEPQWMAYAFIVLPIATVPLWFPRFAAAFASAQNIWLGFIGGIALSYVAIYMLPKLTVMTLKAKAQWPDMNPMLHAGPYLILLSGILSYLLIDRLNQVSSSSGQRVGRYLEYAVHGTYGFLAAYVAVELPRPALAGHVLVSFILVLHMMGMSNLLLHRRPQGYTGARWLLVPLIAAGGIVALVTELPRVVINTTTAYLCGIIFVNVIAEELPLGHKRRFWWFCSGVGSFLIVGTVLGMYYRY